MKQFKLLLIAILGFTTLGFSNPDNTPAPGQIKGAIADEGTNEPVQFATVSIFNAADSSLVTGAVCDDQGTFTIPKIEDGTYYAKIDFIGYDSKIVPNIKVGPGSRKIDLGAIAITSAAERLGEVTIQAEKQLIETKIDKKIFNVSKDPASQGGTGLDALRNVPSVEVDQDDNISLRGDQNVKILVDGRPIAMDVSQFLKQYPASAIEKVEVITNPSAKYNPEGMSGILNIILKKDESSGFNGSVQASVGYGKYWKENGNVSLNYRTPKLNLYTNLSANNNKFWFGGTNYRYNLGDSINDQFTDDEGYRAGLSLSGTVGADYFINDNNTVYISYNNGNTDGSGDIDLYSAFYQQGTRNTDFYSYRYAEAIRDNKNDNLNFGWQKKFAKEGHTLDVDVNRSSSENTFEEEFHQPFYSADVNAPDSSYRQNQDTYGDNSQWFGRLDYTLPINDSTKIEAGINVTHRNSLDGIYYEEFDDNTGAFIEDQNISNEFELTRGDYALYTTFSQKRNKWSYQLGLRAEQTNREAKLINTGESITVKYLELFPTAHLNYEFSKTLQTQLSYSRRLNRPRGGQLNPFASYTNPYSLRTGNPNLRPEFIDVLELGVIQYWKKVNVNATLFYRKQKNMMRRVLTLSDEGINEVSFKNQSSAQMFGSEIILTLTPVQAWRTNITFNNWYNQLKADEDSQDENLNTKGYSLQLSSSYRFKSGISAQVTSRYRGRMEVAQGEITPMFNLGLALSAPVLNKKGTLSLRFNDILGTQQFGFNSGDIGYGFNLERQWESQAAYLSFSYTFGKRIKGPQKRRLKNVDGGDNFSTPGL